MDGKFSLPRSKEAYDDDAELILNQKKSLIRFSADVRTPGLPANARRLGDLRLQCEVQTGIGKKELNFATRAVFNTIFLGGDWCSSRNAKFGFALQDWSLDTTVVHGGKRIPVNAYGYNIVAPLADKSLPDNALVEFEFWADASVERKKEFLARIFFCSASSRRIGDFVVRISPHANEYILGADHSSRVAALAAG